MDRKQAIIEEIQKSDKPVSASKLAKHFGVSRQIIVGDIALLRAAGTQIIATPVFRRSTMNLPAHFHHFLTAGFYNLQI